MASAPQSLPLFYNALEPLSSEQHGNYRLRPSNGAKFLATQHAIPLTVDEFPMAQRNLPIVFSQGDDGVPLALMGLNEGINVFIDENGQLRDPYTYVPAYIRRYPYLLARLRPEAEELTLCFDPSSDTIGAFDEGEPLFADGQPTDVTKNILEFNQQFEEAGYLVETARNGAEGRERFAAAHPYVVVSDVMMPEEDGIKMLEGIRAAHPEDRTPFIFLSNADDMDYVASAMANQAVAYLLKSDRQVDSIVNLVEEKLRKA